jgi:hypothetical protein
MEMKPKIIITDALHTFIFFFSFFPLYNVAHVGFQLYPTSTCLGLKGFVVVVAPQTTWQSLLEAKLGP